MEGGFDRGRRIWFTIPVVLFLALGGLIVVQELLVNAVMGWSSGHDLGVHRIHELLIPYLFLAMLGAMATSLHRPEGKVVPLQAGVAVPALVFLANLAAGEVLPPPLIFLAFALAAVALHPNRAEVFSWGSHVRSLVAWTVAGAIPLLFYAYDQIQRHRLAPPGDEHAELDHWAAMAALAAGIVVLGLLGSQDKPGRRIVGWITVLLAVVFGTASILFPDQPSSLGPGWGAAALVWAVGYAALTVREGEPIQRHAPVSDESSRLKER